jgi:hypothetical protein
MYTEWNSVVIKDCERDVQVGKNAKVYFKWGWNKSFSSSMIMRFTKINSTVRAIFIYLFICLCFGVSVSTVDRVLNSTWVDLINFKWGWNKSPFDISSVVFHFDDFNYGRRSQPYFFLNNCNSAVFFHSIW